MIFLQLMYYLDESKGEFALNIDLDVLLWQESRKYNQLPPLKTTDNLGFVVLNELEMEEFERFKRMNIQIGSSILRCNHLLTSWLFSHKEVCQFVMFGCRHVSLVQKQVDDLCEWVLDLRDQVEGKGRQVLDTLAQHLHDKVRSLDLVHITTLRVVFVYQHCSDSIFNFSCRLLLHTGKIIGCIFHRLMLLV